MEELCKLMLTDLTLNPRRLATWDRLLELLKDVLESVGARDTSSLLWGNGASSRTASSCC